MERRRLGESDLEITPVGLGTWAMGGSGWGFAWGAQDDSRSRDTVMRALDVGVNWIDTAPVYGLGHSEEVVGRALAGLADRPYVFTKCGLVWDGDRQVSQSLSADSVRGEVEASLQRLRVDALDLCQIHWPLPVAQVGEAIAALLDCASEGLVRYVGVSNFSAAQLSEHAGDPRVVSLQSMYSLLNRGADHELFPRAADLGMGVLAYSTMMSGLLTGAMTQERIRSLPADDWRRSHPEFTPPRLEQNLQLVQLLRDVGLPRGASPGEVAVAWVLRQRLVTGAVVGARRPDQVDSFSRAVALAGSDVSFSPIDEHIAGYAAMPDEIHQMAFRGEL